MLNKSHMTSNLVGFALWGFESPLSHQRKSWRLTLGPPSILRALELNRQPSPISSRPTNCDNIGPLGTTNNE